MLLALLYAATSFLGAALLFIIQPLFARMALPLYGGTPSVWNTSVFFFQTVLLFGYVYAHGVTARIPRRPQAILHGLILLVPLVCLPLRPPGAPPAAAEAGPIRSLLLALAMSVGLPFFALSTASPLLQAWFARTQHSRSHDPYFLYAASNLGSMLGLLAYPFVLEPLFPLEAQSRLWTWGYALWLLLQFFCLAGLWRAGRQPEALPGPGPMPTEGELGISRLASLPPVSVRRKLHWIALAFVPSSWMLAVTFFISADIASVPLLWIVPLAAYLLSFIFVFARHPLLPHRWMLRICPFSLMLLVLGILPAGGPWLILGIHLFGFFIAAMVCHGELARDRPEAGRLTTFYVCLSFGGLLGGLFNALIAPTFFRTVLEYPITAGLGCLLLPTLRVDPENPRSRWIDIVLLAFLALAAAPLVVSQPLRSRALVLVGLASLLLGLVSLLLNRRLLFALAIAGALTADAMHSSFSERVLDSARSFYGIHRVTTDARGRYHYLMHGTTLHGCQSLDPARRGEPLAYYHPTGPLGQAFDAFRERLNGSRIAVVGLGSGAAVCYSQPGQHFTFFEIDPAVRRIAETPEFFTFLSDCGQDRYDIILGDGRLRLAEAPPRVYALILLDAFSSESIPIHLLTREALGLYLSKLSDRGVLVFHISSMHLDIEAVLGDLAAGHGLLGIAAHDTEISEEEMLLGKSPSLYAVLARTPGDLQPLSVRENWQPIRRIGRSPWTDQHASILPALRW